MSDKMREAFEKWYMTNTFAHVDHLSVFYNDLNCYPTPIANHCWKAWQAAQSVPVVGEAVNWEAFPSYLLDHQEGAMVTEENIQFWLAAMIKDPQYNKPTHSITAAELERLRKDAERYQIVRDSTYCDVYMHEIYLNDTDLDAAIDAAIAAEVTGNG